MRDTTDLVRHTAVHDAALVFIVIIAASSRLLGARKIFLSEGKGQPLQEMAGVG